MKKRNLLIFVFLSLFYQPGFVEEVVGKKLSKQRQREAAEDLGVPVEIAIKFSEGFKIDLMFIPAGEFMMGSHLTAAEVAKLSKVSHITSSAAEEHFKGEHPLHKVIITKAFYMGKYEITLEQYRAYLNETKNESEITWGDHPATLTIGGPFTKDKGYNYSGNRFGHSKDQPLVTISWYGAQNFCTWLSKKTNYVFRLPTEAEWEYACRADNKTMYYYGNSEEKLEEYAWFTENSDLKPHSVGTKKPNAWGLHDMHGNACEWCFDWFGPYPSNSVADPTGPVSGRRRVLRGGSWRFSSIVLRSAYRRDIFPVAKVTSNGLRVVLEINKALIGKGQGKIGTPFPSDGNSDNYR